ncbi:hypothetical protein MQY53_001622 [Salmonella enterica subsp. enterica]|nr:hypothetical protein [Salmonella enterica subsp. enterica]
MKNNQVTDKRLEEMLQFLAYEGAHYNRDAIAVIRELQERRKADGEPVGEFYEDGPLNWYQISDGDRVPAHRRIPLYRHAPVDIDRLQESAYKAGLTAGWNFGIEHNSTGFSKCLAAHEYTAPPAPVVQCPFPCGWDNLNKLAIQDAAFVARGLVEGETITEEHRQAVIVNNDRLMKIISACRAAMLQGAEPVSQTYKLPEEKGASLQLRNLIRKRHAEVD